MARYPVLLLRAASCKAAICKRSPAVSSVTRRPLCKLCEVKAAICKLVQFRKQGVRFQAYIPKSLHFAVCTLQFANRGSGDMSLAAHTRAPVPHMRAASCKLRAATLHFAARSSQLASSCQSCELQLCTSQLAACTARRFRHRAEKQSFARCTSHFALCSSCPGSVITSNCSAHLALCTSQYVHMSVLPGLQCAPRTSHLATHHSEPHFRRIIHRR